VIELVEIRPGGAEIRSTPVIEPVEIRSAPVIELVEIRSSEAETRIPAR
jgi:hypothetical protein